MTDKADKTPENRSMIPSPGKIVTREDFEKMLELKVDFEVGELHPIPTHPIRSGDQPTARKPKPGLQPG